MAADARVSPRRSARASLSRGEPEEEEGDGVVSKISERCHVAGERARAAMVGDGEAAAAFGRNGGGVGILVGNPWRFMAGVAGSAEDASRVGRASSSGMNETRPGARRVAMAESFPPDDRAAVLARTTASPAPLGAATVRR